MNKQSFCSYAHTHTSLSIFLCCTLPIFTDCTIFARYGRLSVHRTDACARIHSQFHCSQLKLPISCDSFGFSSLFCVVIFSCTFSLKRTRECLGAHKQPNKQKKRFNAQVFRSLNKTLIQYFKISAFAPLHITVVRSCAPKRMSELEIAFKIVNYEQCTTRI